MVKGSVPLQDIMILNRNTQKTLTKHMKQKLIERRQIHDYSWGLQHPLLATDRATC